MVISLNLLKNEFFTEITNFACTQLDEQSSEAVFAIYYGKFQGIAPKASRTISLVEERIGRSPEYDQLLDEIHKMYLTQRAWV